MWNKAEKTVIRIPTAAAHASSVAYCGDTVLLVWFGGSRESADDVDIWYVRREGGIWTEPVRIAAEEGLPHWNPVLYARGDTVDLYYKVGHKIPQWHTRHMRSSDGGRTWTQACELVEGDVGGRGPVRNHPLRLKSGRLLAPASIETPDTWDAFTDISMDDGQTFRKSAFVPLLRDEAELYAAEGPAPAPVRGKGVIQPALWQTDDGTVHMLLRSTEGRVLRSDSTDEGETWCMAYDSGLANNNSGIDLVRTQSGLLFLVLNPVCGNWAARTPLELLVSKDDGNTFSHLMTLENRGGEFSYPSIAAKGNTLFISYTYDRKAVAFWEIGLEDLNAEG